MIIRDEKYAYVAETAFCLLCEEIVEIKVTLKSWNEDKSTMASHLPSTDIDFFLLSFCSSGKELCYIVNRTTRQESTEQNKFRYLHVEGNEAK